MDREQRHRTERTNVPRNGTFLVVIVASFLVACGSSQDMPVAGDPGEHIAGLDDGERGRFLLGRALFQRLATADEGVGPLFNAERCSSCHDEPASGGGGTEILVLKATRFADGVCDPLLGSGGDNIQLRATDLLLAHGSGPEDIPGEATDSVYVVAPPLYGLGLIEAVPDAVLEEWADPDDADGDGISGRLARRPNGSSARFGRKGDASSVQEFIDGALRAELGLTTPDNPVEETRNGVPVPPESDPVPEPEIDAEGVGLLTDYVRLLGAPARADEATAEALRGEGLFEETGCTKCHRREMRTGPSDIAALDSRDIEPWSDFLVHDLGDPAGDVCSPDVAPGEYRTAALWGLRLRDRYMHDGLATDLTAAVSRHGGEGEGARDAFLTLSEADRSALLAFLSTL
jgi:CxxC motif-containing protein (DUF1111 family)